jgi:hypothetical protein
MVQASFDVKPNIVDSSVDVKSFIEASVYVKSSRVFKLHYNEVNTAALC